MKIVIPNPEFYFVFFYTLSFLVTYLLFIIIGKRLRIPIWSLLLMLTTVSLFTIVGSRLSLIPVAEWGQIISSGRFEVDSGRYAVGGLLFGLAGLILSLKILRLGKPIIDLYAWIAPLGFGIQKIGCFFNGCCYGKPSELPWSIRYSMGTNAHFHQWVNGIIENKTDFALCVHPVQLYEVIGLFVIACIVWRSQKYFRKTGNILVFSLSLFFIFRFFIEFFRDPSTSNFNGTQITGIGIVQFFYLVAGVICVLTVILYEKRREPLIKENLHVNPPLETSLLYILFVSCVIFIFRRLFTPFELLSLDMKFIPAILLSAYQVYKTLSRVRFRLAAISFFILPVFLIIQPSNTDTTKSGTIKDFYLNQVNSYKRFDLGTSMGTYYSSVNFNPQEGQCGTTYTSEDYRYIYRMFGAGYSSVKKIESSILTTGLNLYGGTNKEKNLTKQWEKTSFLVGVNPHLSYDLNWLGFGAGAHLGLLRWVPESPIDEIRFDRGTRLSPVLPEAYFRVGRRDIFDLKYTYGFNFPTMIPVPMHEISVGSGFGNRTGFNFRFGAAITDDEPFTFISTEALIDKQIGMTFKLNFGNGSFRYSSDNIPEQKIGRLQLGMNYRFGFEK